MRVTKTNIIIQGFHIDRYGHVNNARYLEFFEQARWQYIEEHLNPQIPEKKNWQFTVVEINIKYKKPLFFKDEIVIETRIEEISYVKTYMSQKIYLKKDYELATLGKVSFIIVDIPTGKPLRVTGDLKKYLETGTI